MDVSEGGEMCAPVLDVVSKTVIAERSFLETVLLGALTRTLGLSLSRIQVTPDLPPADIAGTHVYDDRTEEFTFTEGSVFANIVLADEINRTTPRTQSALLEAMEESQVTDEGETREHPDPFSSSRPRTLSRAGASSRSRRHRSIASQSGRVWAPLTSRANASCPGGGSNDALKARISNGDSRRSRSGRFEKFRERSRRR